jgi:gliding motility-associated-like protein
MWDPVSHVFVGNAFTDTTFFVTLYGYTDCGVDSITKPIFIQPNAVRAFFNTTNFDSCEDLTVRVIDFARGDSLVVSWCFDYDSVNQVCNLQRVPGLQDTLYHTYTDPGDYVIAQFVNNGCSYDTAFFAVQVRPRPVPAFMATDPCEGGQTQFTNLTTIDTTANAQGAAISGYLWDFDGLGSSSQENPVFTFPQAGMYDVTLVAISDRNCTDTLTQSVAIWNHPDAVFSVDTACLGSLSLLRDSSFSVDGSLSNWMIDWGDGNSANLSPPFTNPQAHLYQQPGTYPVTLRVTDSNGCVDSSQATATVLNLPIAAFVTDTVCEGDLTRFVDGSQASSNGFPLVQWRWDFGHGAPIFQTNQGTPFSHRYPAAGIFPASLIVADSKGCEDTLNQLVVVDTLPIAAFAAPPVCFGFATQFSDRSSTTSNLIVAWQWDFGDGSIDSVQNPLHTYGSPGQYLVRLTVSDAEGCSHSVLDTVEVYDLPVATFRPADTAGCLALGVSFRDLSQRGSATINQWRWDFGDGTSDSLRNPGHIYGTVGVFSPRLLVTDSNGCQDDTVGRVEVYSLPRARFAMSDSVGCAPKDIQFTDLSGGDYPLVGWQWNFGDGTSSSLQNPQHRYRDDGVYRVSLQVVDENGCADTFAYPIPIRLSHPVADFDLDPAAICPGDEIQFSDLSLPDTTLANWSWSFGNGGGSSQQNPKAVYHEPGFYSVQLIVENILGCRDTLLRPQLVEVYTPPTADFILIDTAACRPFTLLVDELSSPGSAPLSRWDWDFGDGGTGSGQQPAYVFENRGTFEISLVVTDANGCKDTSYAPIQVNAPIASFFVNDSLPCLPGGMTFVDDSDYQGSVGWRWDFGDGNGQTGISNPTHQYQENGNYLVKMVIMDLLGCSDSVEKWVDAYEYPFDKKEEIVRVTVDSIRHEDVWIEWDTITHPRANVVIIEKSNDLGRSFEKIYSRAVNYEDSVRRFIDRDAYVDRYPIIYRMVTEDSCGYRSPYSNIGKTIHLQARRTQDGVLLNWTRYRDWRFGVVRYVLQLGFRYGNDSDSLDFRTLETFSNADTSYEHMFLDSLRYNHDGDLHYRVKAIELLNRDTVSYSNAVVITGDPLVYIPNAFTPNLDGYNDYFVVNGGEIPWANTYNIKIFDRWGVLIFEGNSVREQHSWDGRIRDTDAHAPEGVYVYQIEVTGNNGKRFKAAGTVTVIR